jgi:hypothetical protein
VSEEAWQQAIKQLTKAKPALIRRVKQFDDAKLLEKPRWVRGPYYLMLHGTLQHTIYHSGQLSLLRGHMRSHDE